MKLLKKTIFKKKLLAVSVASLLLSACGGTGQDQGSVDNSNKQVFSGVAVDGYLARATVFIDSNNNGTRDAWEAFAFTDNDGYYSYNPLTETNYCATGASAQEAQYCLNTNIEYGNVVIRIDGGYDVLTGEPFLGQMSRRVNAQVSEEVTNSVITPITSLLTNVEGEVQRESVLDSLGLQESDLDVDYLNTDGAGDVNPELLNTALKIHKVVAVLSDRLTDTYTEIGEDFGTPNDASSAVYPNLAEQIISSGMDLDVALADDNTLVAVLDAAETSLREVYERKEFTLPADMGSVANPNNFERVVDVASEFSAVVNSLIDVNNASFDISDATGSARALETLVIKTVNETNSDDPSIDNAIGFFDGTSNSVLIDSLIDSLSGVTADVAGLVNNDFSGGDFDSVQEIDQAATLPMDVTPFNVIGGQQIKVSDLDLGSINDLRDIELEAYFEGDSSDIEGAFTACVKFIDGAKSDGSLGDGNTRGELVDGFWSLLGANNGANGSYSLLLTISFLGTTYQAIMKPNGTTMVNGQQVQQLRFDYDGDIATWNSLDGLVASNALPTSNADCESRLPSRVGI